MKTVTPTKFKETEIGLIPEEWSVLPLNSLLIAKNQGVNTTTEKVSYSESGVPIVRANNVADYKIDYDDLVYVDEINYSRIRKECRPQNGDVLYTPIGSQFGSAALVNSTREFGIAWNVMRMQPNNLKITSNFLVYLLNNPENKIRIRSLNASSTMPFVSGVELGKTEFIIPAIAEQKQIAEILSFLDDKIELNRKINANLENLAAALFKKWFVDTRLRRGFGGQVGDELPDGWRITMLGEVINIVYGKGLPTDQLLDSGYPVFGGNGVIGFYDKYLYEEPQVIVGCRGAASGNIKQTYPKSFVTNNSLVLEIPSGSALNRFYLKYFLQKVDINEFVTGSAQPQITIENLRHLEIQIPQADMLTKFVHLVSEYDQLSLANEYESKNLSVIRDSLLPRLMSGKIRVK